MSDETCPGCDGTIARAIQQGREVTTYERCERCERREERIMEHFMDAVRADPPVGFCCTSLARSGVCSCPDRERHIGW